MNYSTYSIGHFSQTQNSKANCLFPDDHLQRQEMFNQKIKFSPLFFDLNRRVYKVFI